MSRKNSSLLMAFASLVASGVLLTGQQPAGGPYTAEQATAGKAAYEANCAACHGSDLMGAPPLAGEGFIGGWRTRTTRDMYGLIRTTMPADNPGGLPGTDLRQHRRLHPSIQRHRCRHDAADADDRRQDRRASPPLAPLKRRLLLRRPAAQHRQQRPHRRRPDVAPARRAQPRDKGEDEGSRSRRRQV